MQKKWYLTVFLIFVLLLCSCADLHGNEVPESSPPTHEAETTHNPGSASPEVTPPDDPEATAEVTPPDDPEATAEVTPSSLPEDEAEVSPPLHSELYLPDYTTQQIIEYFEEVVLNAEYSDGTGADYLVQKWTTPIYYQFYGAPTDTDKLVLNALFEQLNAIPGFPGIYPAEDITQENVSISLLDPTAFSDSFSAVVNGEYAFGAAQFWYYTLTNELYTARIGCRTDLDQETRNSVLPEEIVNILGITDTIMRPDSITYQYSDENTALSDVDLVILTLLYHPSIQCGMDADSCAAIIRELYY